MARQVDVKALISHIIRGDGADRCRICMGDTSEGQVYLGDTVMLDGDRPVTLSELLEIIAGVEVPIEEDLPSGLCSICSVSAMEAANFRQLCRQATDKWDSTIDLLDILPSQEYDSTKILAILNEDDVRIISMNVEPETEPEISVVKTEYASDHESFVKNELSLECEQCGKLFMYPHDLYNHLKESSDNKRACYVCAKVMTRNELVEHLKNVHNKNPYACKKCPALLRSVHNYKKHMATAHVRGVCTCGDCGRSFKSSPAFHAHLSIHNPKNCPGCDKLFRNQKCHLYHVKKCCNLNKNREDAHRTKHKVMVEVKNKNNNRKIRVGMRGSADKQCICDYCGKKYAGKKFVAAHIQIVHMKNTHRPCIYCGKLLAAAHMSEHVKKHELVLSFTCEYCGIVLTTKLGYTQHLRLHTGEKPYACQHCGQTFSASSRRSEHIRNKHNDSEHVLKHKCDFCPARFRLPYRLKKHLNAVHGSGKDEERLQFECSECLEKFSSCRGLLHHSRKHQYQTPNTDTVSKRKTKLKYDFKVYSEPTKVDEE